MHGASGLLLRGGVYYFRRSIPAELREALGKREIKVSLKLPTSARLSS